MLKCLTKLVTVAALLAAIPHAANAQCRDTVTITQATSTETREALDRFGSALTSGDYNGDGYSDLAIGTPEEDWSGEVNSGIAIVHYGTSTGLGGAAWSLWSQNSIEGTANEAGDFFAAELDTGDFNGDGYDDVLIGIPNEDQDGTTNSGRVAVKYGSAAGVTSSADSASWSQAGVAGNGNGDGDNFGATLAVADFDGDGYDDAAIGAPLDEINGADGAGRVVIMYGANTGLNGGNSEAFHQNHWNLTPEAGDHFASALTAGDFNGDGYGDLAIGSDGEDRDGLTNVGWVFVKFGSASGLKASSTKARFAHAALGAVDQDFDELGEHLAAGDIDGDGYDDLAVGIPSKNVNGLDNAGLVGVLFGGVGTSIVNNGRNLQAVSAGEPNQFGINFGGGVHIDDLDEDGDKDVIVGVPRWNGRRGAIAVFFGNGQGSLTTNTQWFDEGCMGGNATDDQYFGQVLSSGDYDGDGDTELAAGDFNHTPDQLGAVFTANISR